MLELNPEQRKAIEHGEGPMLVVAGPGSGKTRVITERIVHLLNHVPELKPEQILAVTFTEKAAGEMKHRVAKSLPGLESSPHISTFHAFCLGVLRERHFERRVLDKVDVWIFLRQRIHGRSSTRTKQSSSSSRRGSTPQSPSRRTSSSKERS